MKQSLAKLLIALFICLCAINKITIAEEVIKKVFINQIAHHPALDNTAKGIIDGLEQYGYKKGLNLDLRIESAQANPVLSAQIATKFVNQNPDIVVGIATIAAQSFIKYAIDNKVKLVFSSVTDPLQAGLVKSLNQPGNNTSGVSNFVELEPQIKLFQKIQPNLKRLGFLYNPAELNSLSLIKKLKITCQNLGIELIIQAANKTADVSQATSKLSANVDAIFISNDNTALAALQNIINIANKAKIPVYVSDTDAVKLGALAALGPNQYQIGIQTAKIIARALNAEDLGTMPVGFPEQMDLYINELAANKLGIKISSEIKKQATTIYSQDKT